MLPSAAVAAESEQQRERVESNPSLSRLGQHGVRIDYWVEPAFFRKIRDRRVANDCGIDVGFEFLNLLEVDPLGGVAPGSQLFDIRPLIGPVGFKFPFETAAAMPPGRGAELVLQSSVRFHAADVEVVIGLWRLLVRIGPGEADAGRAAADARRLEHGDVCPGLSQPKGDRGAHHPGTDHDHLRHGCVSSSSTRIMARDHPAVARRRQDGGAARATLAGAEPTYGDQLPISRVARLSPTSFRKRGLMTAGRARHKLTGRHLTWLALIMRNRSITSRHTVVRPFVIRVGSKIMGDSFISYLRVSTDRQGRSGLGIEAQRAAVKSYLAGFGAGPVVEFVEVESGKRADRPELTRALAECRVRKATLVIAKLDRLARDAHFLLGLQRSDIAFTAADMPNANRLTVGIMAMVAEEERHAIS